MNKLEIADVIEDVSRPKVGLYHRADFDGVCSGAIMYNYYTDDFYDGIKLIGVDHGDNLEKLVKRVGKGKDIIMSDFSVPICIMEKFLENDNRVVWIDHHISAINDYKDFSHPNLVSHLNTEYSAALGTFICFHPNTQIPYALRQVSNWDIWDHKENTVEFQYGLKTISGIMKPQHEVWGTLLFEQGIEEPMEFELDLINAGIKVESFLKELHQYQGKGGIFAATVDGVPVLVLNGGTGGSKVFEDFRELGLVDFEDYPVQSTFRWCKGHWNISLYSLGDRYDCSTIAKRYGGGGHRSAAGVSMNYNDLWDFYKDPNYKLF